MHENLPDDPQKWELAEPALVEEVDFLVEGEHLCHGWTARGLVVTSVADGVSELVRLNLDDGSSRHVCEVEGLVTALAGQREQNRVAAVVEQGGSSPAVLSIDSTTGETETLLESDSPRATPALGWSPDGSYVAVSVAANEPEGIVVVDGRRGAVVDRVALDGGEFVEWDERGVWMRVSKHHPSGWFEAHLWDPDANALQAVSPVRAISPDGEYDVRAEDDAVVVTDSDGVEQRIAPEDDGATVPWPGFPSEWLDNRRLVLDARAPFVLDVSDRTLRPLLPCSPVRSYSISGDIVLFEPRPGELWFGRMETSRTTA